MKKLISTILALALIVSVFSSFTVAFAEDASEAAEVYTEIFNVDFDDMAAVESSKDTAALTEAYPDAALYSSQDAWGYSITGYSNDEGDKYITFGATCQEDADTALQIKMPQVWTENTGVYKLSYDIKLNGAAEWGPFFRVKTNHYGPTNVDPYGPVLHAMKPVDGEIKATYSTATEAESNSTFSSVSENAVTFYVGEWHRAEAIVDTNNSTVDFYYDGTYVGQQSGDTFLSLLNNAEWLQFGVHQGWNAFDGISLDNISISKLTSDGLAFDGDADAITVSLDKKWVEIAGVSGVKAATFVNNATGSIIPAKAKAVAGGVKLSTETALANNTEYVVYLEGASGTTYGTLTLGTVAGAEEEKWTDLFDYNFDDGNVPAIFAQDGVSVESNALKLWLENSSDDIDISVLLSSMGNKGISDATIPAHSGIYELSFDLKVVKSGDKAPRIRMLLSNKKDNINSFPVFLNQWSGQIGAPNPANSGGYDNDYQTLTTIGNETWCKVKMVMDTDTGKIKYYIDDEFKLENSNVNWWSGSKYYNITEGIDNFRLIVQGASFDGEKTSYIDNLKLRKKATHTELFKYSFNNGTVPSQIVSTDDPLSVEDNSLKLSTAGAVDFSFNLASAGNVGKENITIPANSGIYELAFDMKVVKSGNYAPYFRMVVSNDKGINKAPFFVNEWSGQFGAPNQSYSYVDYYDNLQTAADQTWYNVKMVMDTNTGAIKYYIDGELKNEKNVIWYGTDTYNINEGINKIRLIQTGSAYSGTKTSYIDNLTLSKLNINATGFEVTDVYGAKLPGAAAFDRAINTIEFSVDGAPTAADLDAITLVKGGNSVTVDGTYSAQTGKVTVSADEAFADGEYTLTAFGSTYSFKITTNSVCEVYDFTLVDENGGSIAADDTVTAIATIKNGTEDATVIIAVYNGGQLSKVDFVPADKASLVETISAPIVVKDATDVLVKAFLWKTPNSVEPLTEIVPTLYN